MRNISYITNTAATIFSISVFHILSFLNVGNTDIERGLYVFVCWFFVFLVGLVLYRHLPKSISPYVSNFSFSLMMDGVLILTGTLFVMWTIPLFSHNASYTTSLPYFSFYYFIFASLVKAIAQKKYILNILKKGLFFLFVLLVANILPLPTRFQPYTFILAGLVVLLLTGTLLYYSLNRIFSYLSPQNTSITKRD